MVFRACNRCGNEAFKSWFAAWFCDNCYREKVPKHVQEEESSTPLPSSPDRVTIGFVTDKYKGLYCVDCDRQGIWQVSLDGEGLALACSERCLRAYLTQFRDKLPLSIEQCERYGLQR